MDSITIKDVAKICGVGVSTVSRAINNHPDINEETKNMVLQVIREHNYIPNNSARNLKRSVSRTIVVFIKGIDNPFFSAMIKIFGEEIQNHRYSFLLHRVDSGENEVDVAMEVIKEKKPKGIIFLGGYFSHSQKKLGQLDIPFVLSTIASTEQMDRNRFSSISVDDMAESYKMVSYLCGQGHKKSASWPPPLTTRASGNCGLWDTEKLFWTTTLLLIPDGSFTATRISSATLWAMATVRCRR